MSRIAKGSSDPLFKHKHARTIAKSGGLRFSLGCELWECHRLWCRGLLGFRESGEYIMRNRVDIDSSHSRAIVQEIGERLQSSLKEDRELPVTFRMQIERLRQLEGDAQANVLRVKTQLTMLRFNGLVNRIGGPTDAGELVLV